MALLFATSDAGIPAQSKTSQNSASRKLESLALFTPTMGVFALNQIVLHTTNLNSNNFHDFVGLQWYWISHSSDITIFNNLGIGSLLGLTASNFVAISSVSIFVISAVDVIHAIALPTCGVKLDAIPGRISTLKFECELSGLYAGQCSELCGALHGFMPIQVLVFRSSTVQTVEVLFTLIAAGALCCSNS